MPRAHDPLDLQLAYQRVRDELTSQPKTGRSFVANPYELELVELDLVSWLKDLDERIENRTYSPGPIEICDMPKGGGLVRPAARLRLEDRVVYTAAVGACLAHIDAATRWAQGKCDFAPRLNPAALERVDWMRNPFKGWTEMRERSLVRLESPKSKYVVTADIAGYFENISLPLLRSDLLRIGSPAFAVGLIMDCLNEWAVTPERGVPQGVMASDVLAKLYLESFDRRIRSEGHLHMRYVDDIRVFCPSEAEARRALVLLTATLRERGLSLQTAKTRIRPGDDVRAEFEGAAPRVSAITREYIQDAMARGLMAADESLPLVALDELAGQDPDGVPPQALYQAFNELVRAVPNPHPTTFKYLLSRLGARKDPAVVDDCSCMLATHPELTPAILRYFERLERPTEIESLLTAALLAEHSAIYPYQRYLILDWMGRNLDGLSLTSHRLVRALAFRLESIPFVRAQARFLLGKFGDQADLEQLITITREAQDPFERAQALCSLKRLEKSRRNALAGRIKRESTWGVRAGAFVKR